MYRSIDNLLDSLAFSLDFPASTHICIADDSLHSTIPNDHSANNNNNKRGVKYPDEIGSFAYFHPQLPLIHTILLPYDAGLSAGRNACVKYIPTDYFILIDDGEQ